MFNTIRTTTIPWKTKEDTLMSEDKEKKLSHPKNNDLEDAPESGTVVQKNDPSKPFNAGKDGDADSIGEAPESGTFRDR